MSILGHRFSESEHSQEAIAVTLIFFELLNLTVFRPDLQPTSPNTYYMFRVAAYDASGSLIGHFSNYYKNGYGGWFEFGVL